MLQNVQDKLRGHNTLVLQSFWNANVAKTEERVPIGYAKEPNGVQDVMNLVAGPKITGPPLEAVLFAMFTLVCLFVLMMLDLFC